VHSLVETDSNYLAVSTNDYREICDAIRRRSGHDELSVMLAAWRDEPTSIRFTRMAEQAQRMAERIGKTISVDIDHGGVRLDPQRFGSVWSALMHAVRNAVDHGLEAAPERASAEKAGLATLTLASRIVDGDVVLEISDNGRGIDWDKVQKKASALAVPCATPAELEAALFHDGVSTKEGVTEISGRGVGMGALKALCESLGGHVRLESESGQGTRLAVYIPLAAAHGARAA
jgi:two-component system chemotaxis sensor kinase CheA